MNLWASEPDLNCRISKVGRIKMKVEDWWFSKTSKGCWISNKFWKDIVQVYIFHDESLDFSLKMLQNQHPWIGNYFDAYWRPNFFGFTIQDLCPNLREVCANLMSFSLDDTTLKVLAHSLLCKQLNQDFWIRILTAKRAA